LRALGIQIGDTAMVDAVPDWALKLSSDFFSTQASALTF